MYELVYMTKIYMAIATVFNGMGRLGDFCILRFRVGLEIKVLDSVQNYRGEYSMSFRR